MRVENKTICNNTNHKKVKFMKNLKFKLIFITAFLFNCNTVFAANIVGIAIDGTNNNVYTYYDNFTVTAGSTSKLSSKRKAYKYKLPKNRKPSDIVGIGIDGSNNYVFAWYKDGTVSAGTTKNLASKRKPYKYALPKGKKPNDIAGVGIDGTNNLVIAIYKDGTVSAGTTKNLGKKRSLKKYKLPSGKKPNDIIGMGVDGYILGKDKGKNVKDSVVGLFEDLGDSNYTKATKKAAKLAKNIYNSRGSLCFAWYKDGMVSAGSSTDFNEVREPYKYMR